MLEKAWFRKSKILEIWYMVLILRSGKERSMFLLTRYTLSSNEAAKTLGQWLYVNLCLKETICDYFRSTGILTPMDGFTELVSWRKVSIRWAYVHLIWFDFDKEPNPRPTIVFTWLEKPFNKSRAVLSNLTFLWILITRKGRQFLDKLFALCSKRIQVISWLAISVYLRHEILHIPLLSKITI